ncbi:helix-hairpin-helix domain-containing protein [Alkaliphilus transvaalensis]|uniref:helix-hairpin-helix domain-containing protein n=1 Tax=Alkaliphilus transvaalensis TaxID=114628 RepID=UPI000478BF5B|nr:helix-hairpin-helix domain-containing protein [Alkaliphilus transvaalensis]
MQVTIKQKYIIFIMIGVAMLGISFWSHQKDQGRMYEVSGKEEESDVEWNIDKADNGENPSQSEKMIMVHVKGEVISPGVYELKEGARVIDAVEAAGGFTEEADQQQVNLAMKIFDEDAIIIYKEGEVSAHQPVATGNISNSANPTNINNSSRNSGKININSASKGELTQLSGIGEALAERIIVYRQEKGAFKSIEEIKNVSGIGDKKFEEIKEKISVQ